MVGSSRGTSDTRRIRRLKPPRAVEVEAGEEGTPLRLRLGRGPWQDVTLVRRPWRVDQHWWRPSDQVSRLYYRVAPEDGPPLTLYRDLITGEWARQEY
jgi:hypothetical protein